MPRLVMCKGLPGSGKSHWAKAQDAVRVNQDDLRKGLGWTSWATWDFKSDKEKQVHALKKERIIQALKDGHDVISDDTNLSPARESELRTIASELGATFAVEDFTHIPISLCIKRDADREPDFRVGAEVIRKMAAGAGIVEEVEANENLMRAIICDLDGTLAHANGRGPYEHQKCDEDTIDPVINRIILTYHRHHQYQIIYLSGRDEEFRPQTEAFLWNHDCPPGPLHMRGKGDRRKDSIVKRELFDAHVRGKYNVEFVLDDRNQVVEMWRSLGLKCLQVAPGDF